jgi:hypothetical protein
VIQEYWWHVKTCSWGVGSVVSTDHNVVFVRWGIGRRVATWITRVVGDEGRMRRYRVKVKVKIILKQTTKFQRGSRGIALLFP